MEQALIARAHVFPHPNAHSLQLAVVAGYSVVVGMDTEEDELGIFFSSELVLSDSYCTEHDLIERKDELGNRAGGYFKGNGRVRAQRLRGQRSEGYFAPLSSLAYTGGDISELKEGDMLTEFNGVEICTKYLSPATLRAIRNSQGVVRTRRENKFFPKHVDTVQLRHKAHLIQPGDHLTFTRKLHGTSARTGKVKETKELPRRLHQKILRRPAKIVTEFEVLTGTRNVVLTPGKEDAWYTGSTFRRDCTELFGDLLREGEVVYYEIVGWAGPETPVMGRHQVSKALGKEESALKLYPAEITYTYGCAPGESEIYVYRITQAHDDPSDPIELSWSQVKQRCRQLGLKHVPEEAYDDAATVWTGNGYFYDGDIEKLTAYCEAMAEGPEPLDHRHPKEGVVIRVDGRDGYTWFLKYKSYLFRVLEGIAWEDPTFVDLEAAS